MYRLSELDDGKEFRADSRHPAVFDHSAVLRGEESPPSGLTFVWCGGKKSPSNFVWTTGRNLLVGQEARELLSGFSGWQSFPVTLLGADESILTGYHILVVHGRCGLFKPHASIPLPGATEQRKGLCFEDDEPYVDICVPPENVRFIFVRDHVQQALRNLNAPNLLLERWEDIVVPEMVYEVMLDKHLLYRRAKQR